MKSEIPFQCHCGKVRGLAHAVSSTQNYRSICLCDDCQAYAHFLGRAQDLLDINGGTDIYPLTPAQLKIQAGEEHLKCMRLSEKGMHRWYAGCCNTPLGNTMSPKIAFVGLPVSTFNLPTDTARTQALGPVRARVQAKWAIGTPPQGSHPHASLGLILFAARMFAITTLKRQHQPSPFYNDDLTPKATPKVLTKSELIDLKKQSGPSPDQN